jgi:hypothetical protein
LAQANSLALNAGDAALAIKNRLDISNVQPVFIFARNDLRKARKKPMRHVDPHRQYAFSQSAGTTVYLVEIARDVQ